MLGAAPGGAEGEGAGVGEAIQHRAAHGKPRHRLAVVFLIQKESGFLSVDEIHPVADAVFHDVRPGEIGLGFSGQREPALALR